MSSEKAPAIGIDLGTTFSCVGVFKDGKVHIIPNPEGTKTTPSYVAFTDNGRLVGARAKKWALIDPDNTVSNIKRLIGRSLDDEAVQDEIRRSSFKVVDDGTGKPSVLVQVDGNPKFYRPEEISAMVLREMKLQAESFLNLSVQDAVITVPAYFNDAQRQATQDAGRIAGLNVLGIINEPTAAALAYGFDNIEGADQHTLLIYDFGGGTFDVSILKIEDGNFHVLSTGGDGHMGGEDIDNLLLDYFCQEFTNQFGPDMVVKAREECTAIKSKADAKKALKRLRYACEKAKIELSSKSNVEFELPSLFEGHDFESQLWQQWFVRLIEDFARSTLLTVGQVLGEANLPKSAITDVILVGGSTRIPMIQTMLREYFAKDPCGHVNPDEAVAYGAAIQAAILSGVDAHIVHNIHLRDVTPLSLGIETFGGVMATIIRRNTPVPVQRTKTFSTSRDNQTTICFQVFEGERVMTEFNNLLGEFTLVGVPPAPRRIPQIEVVFGVDANGILKVSAMDLSTEWENGIEITNNRGRLSPEEIEAAIADAERNREQDLQKRKKVSAKADLQVYVNKISGTIKNIKLKEKIEPDTLERISQKLNESQRLFEDHREFDEDLDFDIKRSELEELWTPVVTKLYQPRNFGNQAPPTLLHDPVDDAQYEIIN